MTGDRHERLAKLTRGDVEARIFGRHIPVRRIECDPHAPDKLIIHDPHQKILDIRKSRVAEVGYASAIIAVPYAAEEPVARVSLIWVRYLKLSIFSHHRILSGQGSLYENPSKQLINPFFIHKI